MTTRYTKDHEWVRLEGDVATVGITPYAAEQLGDVVYVELPAAGASFAQWQAALQAVTYSNTSQDPNTADRIINITVNDGQPVNSASNTAVATVHITANNDAQVRQLVPRIVPFLP